MPWRYGGADYRDGLALNSRPKRLPAPAGKVLTPWDHALAHTMCDHLMAVEEETVIDYLLADLAGLTPTQLRAVMSKFVVHEVIKPVLRTS